MNDHHIWCNIQKGPVDKCKQCICLFAFYPLIEGDEDGSQLVQRYFPEAIPITKKVKERENA